MAWVNCCCCCCCCCDLAFTTMDEVEGMPMNFLLGGCISEVEQRVPSGPCWWSTLMASGDSLVLLLILLTVCSLLLESSSSRLFFIPSSSRGLSLPFAVVSIVWNVVALARRMRV